MYSMVVNDLQTLKIFRILVLEIKKNSPIILFSVKESGRRERKFHFEILLDSKTLGCFYDESLDACVNLKFDIFWRTEKHNEKKIISGLIKILPTKFQLNRFGHFVGIRDETNKRETLGYFDPGLCVQYQILCSSPLVQFDYIDKL